MSEDLPRIDELERRVIEYEEKLAVTLATSSAREAELKLLAASDEGKRTIELKKSLEEKREELAQAKDEMVDLIAPLTKALSRIMKQGSSDRLNLQHGDVFMQLSKSPSKVQDLDISGSLEELRSHLASLGLKDRKKEKTLDHIDHLISEKSLQKAKSKRVALEDEIKDLEAHLTKSSGKASHLRDELNLGKKSMQSLQVVLDQSRENLAALKEKASMRRVGVEREARKARQEIGRDRSISREMMKVNLGGIIPLSTVDWTGRAALVVFLRGCPLRCPHCQNRDLQEGDSSVAFHVLASRIVSLVKGEMCISEVICSPVSANRPR